MKKIKNYKGTTSQHQRSGKPAVTKMYKPPAAAAQGKKK